MFKFPKNFYWGAATSAYQVEGGIDNCDWAKVYPAGAACDHYNRYEEDFDIAKSLGHNAHRFSIEWSRIEPEEGRFNEKEIEHYKNVIMALKQRGVEPFVTIWHWPVPLWLRDKGGWENKKTIEYFFHYVDKIMLSLKSIQVKFWITLNEPEIYASNSYLKGVWPPQKKNFLSYIKVLRNLIKAHCEAYKIIKKINPGAQVGIAKNNIYFEGWLALFIDWWWNFYFLNQIRNFQDFIGLNYYFHNRIKGFKFNQNENRETSDMGWEIYPKGIYHVLKDLKKYNKPIYITENGLADAKDEKREKFIKEHLQWAHKAIQEGVDLRGYFYWSLLDNFEWDKGFWPRFGLVEIDYQTLERKIRPSALEYKKIIKTNGL
ncbi:MAG: glycoside hydrolase family 1 protein [Candidatus Terrybacteria bacterium]|nr:glycoside hydrolase family 1 protein [Candidatus Terrybacteria bacterium]